MLDARRLTISPSQKVDNLQHLYHHYPCLVLRGRGGASAEGHHPNLQEICETKRKEKTTPFGVNLMRSQVLYRAAQKGEEMCACACPHMACPLQAIICCSASNLCLRMSSWDWACQSDILPFGFRLRVYAWLTCCNCTHVQLWWCWTWDCQKFGKEVTMQHQRLGTSESQWLCHQGIRAILFQLPIFKDSWSSSYETSLKETCLKPACACWLTRIVYAFVQSWREPPKAAAQSYYHRP